MDEEKKKVFEDNSTKRDEVANLAAEVQRLREQLEREKAETESAVAQYTEKIEREQRESTRAQMKLMKAQMQGSAKDSESAIVKKEVVEKTHAIKQAMREMREQQLEGFKKVKKLTYDMLQACSKPSPNMGSVAEESDSIAGVGSTGGGPIMVNGAGFGSALSRSPSPSITGSAAHFGAAPQKQSPASSLAGGLRRPPSNAGREPRSPASSLASGLRRPPSRPAPEARERGALSAGPEHRSVSVTSPQVPSISEGDDGTRRWFKAMKANLEQFGDVEVFTQTAPRECACCLQEIATPYRVRPRRCGHIFHVECLLRWWTEGTCPVCRVSFAPDEASDARPTARSGSVDVATPGSM